MQKTTGVLYLILFLLIMVIGCSNHHQNAITSPEFQSDLPSAFVEVDENNTNHNLLGTWTINLNLETLEAVISQDRTSDAHFNVTSLLPSLGILINSYDPGTEIIDVDVTITNPYAIDVYDVRLIIYTDPTGHMLQNDDCWTPLYDIPGGFPINPFKAYAKAVQDRLFAGQTEQTENLQILLPGGNPNVTFAIDASYPGNCEEPHKIGNLSQEILYDQVGSSAMLQVGVYDHQNNVNSVNLYCPDITGTDFVPFTYIGFSGWELDLINNTGAIEGEYCGFFVASSENSGSLFLYDKVVISVASLSSPFDLEVVDDYRRELSGQARRIAVSENLAFVHTYMGAFGESYNYLNILSLDDPVNPEFRGWLKIGEPRDFTIQDGYLYVTIKDQGLIIVDFSNPSFPWTIGEAPFSGDIYSGIAVNGNYAYLCYDGLTVADVSDPTNPNYIQTIPFDHISDIKYRDGYLFLVAGGNFRVVDVRIPSDPQLVSSLSIDQARYLDIKGNYAYIIQPRSSGYSEISVIDISDLDNPATIFQIDDYDSYYLGRVSIRDDYMFVCAGNANYGLLVYDISNPEIPVEIAVCTFPGTDDIALSGMYAYMPAGWDGLFVVNVTDPNLPFIENTVDSFTPKRIEIYGDHSYISEESAGFTVLDINDPSNVALTVFNEDIDAHEMLFNGFLCYVASGNSLIEILDCVDPGYPVTINQAGCFGYPSSLDIEGNRLYAVYSTRGSGSNKLTIYDISDRVNPDMIGVIPSTSTASYRIKVQNGFGYIAATGSFEVYDVSRQWDILLINKLNFPQPRDIELKGNYAYVADQADGLVVVDISNPLQPVKKASLQLPAAVGVTVEGNYAYIANLSDGLYIVDISNPLLPLLVESTAPGGLAVHVAIKDNYAYVATLDYGIWVLRLWE